MSSIASKWFRPVAAFALPCLLLLTGLPANVATAEDVGNAEAKSTVQLVHERISDAVVLYLGSPLAKVKDEWFSIDDGNPAVKPMLINSRTMVPIRFVAESMGATVGYSAQSKTVDIYTDAVSIRLRMGSRDMLIQSGNKTLRIDSPPVIIDSRTYVPLRAISEAFGWYVMYERNLITVSEQSIIHPVNESNLIDELIAWFQDGRTFGTRSFDIDAVDMVTNDRQPIVYLASVLSHAVYAYNYRTGKMTEAQVPSATLLDYRDGKLYVWENRNTVDPAYNAKAVSAIYRLDGITLKQLGMFNLDTKIEQMSVFPDGTIVTYGGTELRSYSQSGQLLSKQTAPDAKAVFHPAEGYVSVAATYFRLEKGLLALATPDANLNLFTPLGATYQLYNPTKDLIYSWNATDHRVTSSDRLSGGIVASAPRQFLKEIRVSDMFTPGIVHIQQVSVYPMKMALADGKVVAFYQYGSYWSNYPRKTLISSYLQRELGK